MYSSCVKLTSAMILTALMAVSNTSIAAASNVPVRATAPARVPVPADIATFLKDLGAAYGSTDSAQVADFLSSDFLHQGMNRNAFLKHLKTRQQYLGELTIVPISFAADKDKATVVAYAVAPSGPLGPSLQTVPLHVGATLIREDGHWKLHGNQQKKELPLYKEVSLISADIPATDIDAYKRYVPAGYDMPEKPTVRIAVVNWTQIEAPQMPYWLAHLNILVSRDGTLYWHLLAMPEGDWLAVEAGKVIGFPKFNADFDIQRSSNNQWQAVVSSDGANLFSAAFEPDTSAQAGVRQETSPTLFFGKDGNPVVERMAPMSPPTKFQRSYGWMIVNTQAPMWRDLIKSGTRAAAINVELNGAFKISLGSR